VPSGHPVVVYTALRLLVLLAVGAVLFLVGLRDVWLLVFAFLISGFISMVALSRRREGAAWGITSAVKNLNQRIDAGARAEDDEEFLPAADPAVTEPAATEPVATEPVATEPVDEWDDPR
jgi:hypothetical protein